jgi:hypothetical protein
LATPQDDVEKQTIATAKNNSRFPAGMTTRKAKTTATARAKAAPEFGPKKNPRCRE